MGRSERGQWNRPRRIKKGHRCWCTLDGVVNTHLINFGPQADGTVNVKPVWKYQNNEFTCNLRCHGENMDNCRYQSTTNANQPTGGSSWCAGSSTAG